MGKFVIIKGTKGEYQFSLKTINGQPILISEEHSSKPSCEKAIEAVRQNSQDDARFIRKSTSDGVFYFTLEADNGQILGISEFYKSQISRATGISSVKSIAPDAFVDDHAILYDHPITSKQFHPTISL